MAKEMKILIPTTKIQESVKCKNTKQAYKIFKEILDYEEYELKNQEHFWIMGVDSVGYVARLCTEYMCLHRCNWF